MSENKKDQIKVKITKPDYGYPIESSSENSENKDIDVSENLRPLNRQDQDKIEEYLGYKIDIPDSFWQRPDEERTFYDLIDILLEENRATWADWKWNPEDVFWYLGRIFPQHGFELIQLIEENPTFENVDYKIIYKFDGQERKITIPFHGLWDWIDYLNKELIAKDQFRLVGTYTGWDEYVWLLAKADFDEAVFQEFIQEKSTRLAYKDVGFYRDSRVDFNNLNSQPVEKIFFVPKIVKDIDSTLHVLECNDNGVWRADTWAGRILPNQTIQQAIASELKDVLKYIGNFKIREVVYLGMIYDKQHIPTRRYGFTIKLLNDLDVRSLRISGKPIRWNNAASWS